ncbi:hypothetical protein D9611_004671 [Ephemerocybe angulata]|uniref:Cyclin-like domain-containing protein n=1 Tax=Ephemerocybe angulata TaxID=980116 RepID=A0A8H5B348_9AGAR|nr:hypothetical protein D9611_004671 [Tulosesus angulatus]
MSTTAASQWLFPLSALDHTPSACSLDKELYDRARGVEFLFRLGSSLQLPTSALCTAATWFHRFYMRYSMEEFHRQDVAATCIFLATKTEECGRKLIDVARIYQTKVPSVNVDPKQFTEESQEVNERSAAILSTEEVLLEALCFDFFVESPHAELVDLFEKCDSPVPVQEFAWSLAHDSYRTPLCILYPPKIIATACYVLAQRIFDGPNSPSLDARISATSPASHLPTPPSHKPPSPDATRVVVERYAFDELELVSIGDALGLLLEFYGSQDIESTFPYLANIVAVPPPTKTTPRPRLYVPATQINAPPQSITNGGPSPSDSLGRTPNSTHGGHSPDPTPASSQNA